MFAKHGFQNLAERLHLGRFILKRSSEEEQKLTAPERLRIAFEDLGPTFVKLGQLLSTRPDLIPIEFVEEFKKLQSQVPSLPFSEIQGTLQEHANDPSNNFSFGIFESFDEEPLAAASMAQVHKAKLLSGEKVVVKIQRPGIIETIDEDLGVLYQLAHLIERYVPEWDIYDPIGIIDEFFRTLELETDFIVEANNIRRFQELFAEEENIKIPQVYLEHCGSKVLVIEALQGIPLSDNSSMEQEGIDKSQVVETGLDCYFKMVFQYGIFHGDLHAGNFFILKNNQVGLIDFGVVGRLNRKTQDSIINMLMALATEDYDRVAYEYIDLAPYSEGLDADRFARDLRELVAPYYGLTLKNINIGKLLLDSASIAAKHRVKLPSELMLFFKSMISIESLGRQMVDDFDFLQHSLKFAGELVKSKYDPKKILQGASNVFRDTSSLFYDLPRQLRQLVRKISSPHFIAKFRVENISEVRQGLEHAGNLIFLGLVTSALIIAGAMTMSLQGQMMIAGIPLTSLILFALAGFYILVAFYNYIKK